MNNLSTALIHKNGNNWAIDLSIPQTEGDDKVWLGWAEFKTKKAAILHATDTFFSFKKVLIQNTKGAVKTIQGLGHLQ
ncbi:hypothetical protein N9917_04085 [Deltaproteobacteria bacterium]|nr:hypothetical protein [Deltaproteobacteria bacterium]